MARVLGIRREDKSRWERRAPLVPDDVARLVERGVEVIVQPSEIRVFDDDLYRAAGARVREDLSPAELVLAVKEVPEPLLLPDRAYAFFAHVVKGQAHNMGLLRRLLDRGITLVDYEQIEDDAGSRLVKFGRQAGQAGMVETLAALGARLASEGRETPLLDVRQPFHYGTFEGIRDAFGDVHRKLAAGFEPPADGHVAVGFTGRGSVTRGALEVFELLPHEEVTPEELPRRLEEASGEQTKLLLVRLEKHHLAAPKDPNADFDEAEYRRCPERYRGRLSALLPHLTALLNGIYWTDEYPRLVTRTAVREMWRRGHRRLRVIGDVSCDIEGSVELTHEPTQPDAPTYTYDPVNDSFHTGLPGPGISVMAVDNLPCELSVDASREFSQPLHRLVVELAETEWDVPFSELALPPELRRAVVTHRGELTPDYRYLRRHLEAAGLA